MSLNEDPSTWRLQTPGGIPFKLVEQSGEFGEEDSTATQIVIIEANRLLDFVLEGFPVPYTFGGGLFYPRRTYFAGLPSLTVKRITWESHDDGLPCDPFAADSGAPSGTYHGFLRCTITYGTAPVNDSSGGSDPNDPRTFMEFSSVASGEFVVSPIRGESGDANWREIDVFGGFRNVEVREADVGQPVNQSLIEHSVRWTQIPYTWFDSTLYPRLRTCMGKVNSAVMTVFSDAPAETIMFLGFSASHQYTWRTGNTGTSPIALDLKFLEKNFLHTDVLATDVQVTHNHLYRPGSGFRRMEIGGQPLYTKYDLNEIFDA